MSRKLSDVYGCCLLFDGELKYPQCHHVSVVVLIRSESVTKKVERCLHFAEKNQNKHFRIWRDGKKQKWITVRDITQINHSFTAANCQTTKFWNIIQKRYFFRSNKKIFRAIRVCLSKKHKRRHSLRCQQVFVVVDFARFFFFRI